MDFNEKLQKLRKQKGLTQEELAEALFVSRTAISKWESGRGYPNIDSLKHIAQFFSVSVDELLSGDEIIMAAEADSKRKENTTRDIVFGLLDISTVMLIFLPFFGEKINGIIQGVSLLTLSTISHWLKVVYIALVACVVLFGVLTLALQGITSRLWVICKGKISLVLNILITLVFIVSLQPYVATILFVFLIIKVMMLVKLR